MRFYLLTITISGAYCVKYRSDSWADNISPHLRSPYLENIIDLSPFMIGEILLGDIFGMCYPNFDVTVVQQQIDDSKRDLKFQTSFTHLNRSKDNDQNNGSY